MVLSLRVGYGSAPTLTVQGNGSNAVATATISGGQVVKVEVADSSDASLLRSQVLVVVMIMQM